MTVEKDGGEEFTKKVKIVKELLRELHKGEDISRLKERFKDQLVNIAPFEIPLIEQELVKEGLSPFEIAKMCELHVELFRGFLVGRSDLLDLKPGHPLHTLLRENEEIVKDAEKIGLLSDMLTKQEIQSVLHALRTIATELPSIRRHFVRMQLLVFPYIERRGITAVPRVLWTKEDQLMVRIKKFNQILRGETGEIKEYVKAIRDYARDIGKELTEMVFRENNILYPTLRTLLTEGEWAAIKQNEDMLGFYKIKPGNEWMPSAEPIYPYQLEVKIRPEQIEQLPAEIRTMVGKTEEYKLARQGDLELEDGLLLPGEIAAILKTIPIDMSFIDADDRARYYNRANERIFPRAKTVLGRRVQFCHPPASVNIVTKIIEEFRAGKKQVAEFLINVGGRQVHIRYFPVRDQTSKYLGTLEVVQDITDIKKLEGEKRLLDWR